MKLQDFFQRRVRFVLYAAALLVVGAGSAAGAFRLAHWAVLHQTADATVTPFTLTMEGYDFQDNASGQMYLKETIARRSDGSTVSLANPFASEGLASADTTRSLRLADGRGYWVYDGISGFSEWPMLPEERLAAWKSQMVNQPADCVRPNETLLQHDTILGHSVAVIKTHFALNNEQDTDWRAPDLGCQLMRNRVDIRQSDGSLKIKAENDAVTLTIGEPDARLFDIPTSYATMKPSEAGQTEAKRLGIIWTADMEKSAERDDFLSTGQPVPASLQ